MMGDAFLIKLCKRLDLPDSYAVRVIEWYPKITRLLSVVFIGLLTAWVSQRLYASLGFEKAVVMLLAFAVMALTLTQRLQNYA